MPLADDFKKAAWSYSFVQNNAWTLRVKASNTDCVYDYDFLARFVIIKSHAPRGTSISAIPFSQLDRESLEFFRNVLIEKGGTPPALPDNHAPQIIIGKSASKPKEP